jgi:hypothetical protein
MVLANLKKASKIGKAVLITKKIFTAKPLLDDPMTRFPKAEIASAKDVLAFLARSKS